jgi:hypothetical protein
MVTRFKRFTDSDAIYLTNDLAELRAMDTVDFINYSRVYVKTLGEYILRKNSSLIDDSLNVITADGGGRWIKISGVNPNNTILKILSNQSNQSNQSSNSVVEVTISQLNNLILTKALSLDTYYDITDFYSVRNENNVVVTDSVKTLRVKSLTNSMLDPIAWYKDEPDNLFEYRIDKTNIVTNVQEEAWTTIEDFNNGVNNLEMLNISAIGADFITLSSPILNGYNFQLYVRIVGGTNVFVGGFPWGDNSMENSQWRVEGQTIYFKNGFNPSMWDYLYTSVTKIINTPSLGELLPTQPKYQVIVKKEEDDFDISVNDNSVFSTKYVNERTNTAHGICIGNFEGDDSDAINGTYANFNSEWNVTRISAGAKTPNPGSDYISSSTVYLRGGNAPMMMLYASRENTESATINAFVQQGESTMDIRNSVNGYADTYTAISTKATKAIQTITLTAMRFSGNLHNNMNVDENNNPYVQKSTSLIINNDGINIRAVGGYNSTTYTEIAAEVNITVDMLPTFTDNASASSLTAGTIYKTPSGELRIKV